MLVPTHRRFILVLNTTIAQTNHKETFDISIVYKLQLYETEFQYYLPIHSVQLEIENPDTPAFCTYRNHIFLDMEISRPIFRWKPQ